MGDGSTANGVEVYRTAADGLKGKKVAIFNRDITYLGHERRGPAAMFSVRSPAARPAAGIDERCGLRWRNSKNPSRMDERALIQQLLAGDQQA
jgi:hypothetical protein